MGCTALKTPPFPSDVLVSLVSLGRCVAGLVEEAKSIFSSRVCMAKSHYPSTGLSWQCAVAGRPPNELQKERLESIHNTWDSRTQMRTTNQQGETQKD